MKVIKVDMLIGKQASVEFVDSVEKDKEIPLDDVRELIFRDCDIY